MAWKSSLAMVVYLCFGQITSTAGPHKQSPVVVAPKPVAAAENSESAQGYLYEPAGSLESGFLVYVRPSPYSCYLSARVKSLPDFANPQTQEELAAMLEEQRGLPNGKPNRWMPPIDPRFLLPKEKLPPGVVLRNPYVPIVTLDELRRLNESSVGSENGLE